MEITKTDISDVLLIKPTIHTDSRGFFMEAYREEELTSRGIDVHFVQDNLSKSHKDTVRGLHYQIEQQQDKLIMVMEGKILDVAVDMRKDSPTFGEHVAHELSEDNRHQMFIPKGFAHGFSVLSEETMVYYKCSDYYYPVGERGVLWNDPQLDIDWKVDSPIISGKDKNQPTLDEIKEEDLF